MWSRSGLTCLGILSVLAITSVRVTGEDLLLPTPLFPSAVELWHDARPNDALVALDHQLNNKTNNDQSLEALVLRATLLTATGQNVESETLWKKIIDRQVWMRTFSRRKLVESLVSRGNASGALIFLTELINSDATRHLDLIVRAADLNRRLGDIKTATRLYRLSLSRQSRGSLADSARLGLAATFEQRGDLENALITLREAQLHHSDGDAYERARQEERRLVNISGQEPKPFTERQHRTIVRRLRNSSRFESALGLLNEWKEAHDSIINKDLIAAERIYTLYAQRANELATIEIQQFTQQFQNSEFLPNILLTGFRLAVRMGRTRDAINTGLDLWEGRVPRTTNQQRRAAAELLASYLVAVGDVPRGLDLYQKLFRSSRSANDQRTYLWRAGVASLRVGQIDRALTNLQGLVSRRPSGELYPASRYWLGVAQLYANDNTNARKTFESIAEQFPYHYYGMRATERLLPLTINSSNKIKNTTRTFPVLNIHQTTLKQAEYKAAILLGRAGLIEDAAWYLRRLLERRRNDRGLALLAARASTKAGHHAEALKIIVNHFGTYLQRPSRELPNDFWELVYPRPFLNTIKATAESQGLDPILLLSLMRQESRFDPEARSPVGALGLFQIMPYTAEELAESAGVSEILDGGLNESSLTQPSVNSAIAATLTGKLLKMFDGTLAPVIASYNAGSDRVALWWETSRNHSDDFFVDMIPYSETRRFVREVLANYANYQRVYSDK